jgi:hypothetical protein
MAFLFARKTRCFQVRSASVSTIDLIITFDTEDVYYSAEAGRDGVIKDLADILSDEGVPANFILIARRAALLEERGREDIIGALRRHCVGVHTLAHDQPVSAVVAADLDWAGGLEVCRQAEGEAFRVIAEAFNCQPVCLSGHHLYEAPQNYVVAREMGLPYLYGYAAAPPLFSVSRFCGALNISYTSPLIDSRDPFLGYFDGFDDVLSSDPDFDAHLERFARRIDASLVAGYPVLLIHPCHPVKTYTLDWIDSYLTPNGVNIPPEERLKRPSPGLRTLGEMELVRRNFRRLVRFIRNHPQLNVITLPEAVAKFGRFPTEIGRVDLFAAAQRACLLDEVVIEERYSSAEVLMGFAEALLLFAREGHLPESLPRSEVLGPLQDPLIVPEEPGELGWQGLLDLAVALRTDVLASGYLPANVPLRSGARVGLGSLYRACAEAYLITFRDGQPPEKVELARFDRQPSIGCAIGRRYTQVSDSPMVVPNLNIDRLYRMSKLQSWTLAPAWHANT